jgi:tetratricopeptide (TPR) repeat protein
MSTVGMTNRLELNSFAETALKAAAHFGFNPRTQDRAGASRRVAKAAGLLVVTVALGAGIFAVSMAVWLPIVKAAYDNRKSIADTLSATIAHSGIDRAVKQYHDLQASQPAIYNFDEDQLNTLGYQLLRANKFKKAIRIFQLNVEAYPQSSNVYDSLGEAYMDDGNKALAIANYQKSLQLNPKNRGAVRMLQKLDAPGFVLRRPSRGPI